MSCDLVPRPAPAPLALPDHLDLLTAFLAGRNPRTLRAYDRDLQDFARFLEAPSPRQALTNLIALPHGTANACALAYRAHLVARSLAPATIARRLAALRSVVKLARTLGQVSWSLEIANPRVESYRDTRGPGEGPYKAVLALLRGDEPKPQARRDMAVVRLLHDLALRREEVVSLDLAHVDLTRGTVEVLGKGKGARVPLTLPDPLRHALADWIACRGDAPGPLFSPRAGAGPGSRLTGRGVAKILRSLATRAGLSGPFRPHGLRHQAITSALDKTGGDVRAVRRFSRHSKLDTLLVYDDNRRDLAGDVARLVSED